MNDKLKSIAEKKKQLDKLKPIKKDVLEELENWLKIELTYSSNAIEGNTLTWAETAEVLEKGVSAVIPGKPLKDQLEALNHAKAVDYIKELAKKRKSHQFITEEDIKSIHKIILEGINNEWAGKYRLIEVFIRISNAEFPPPRAVPRLMKELINWLEGQQDGSPVRIAEDAHFKFVTIHPFLDGNGRVGRLLMNLILLIHGYPIVVIRNEDRIKYIKTFDYARQDHNMQPFYDLIEAAVERSLDAYINAALGKPVMPVLAPIVKKPLLKIGDLARETDESVYTLRFWLKIGLLKESKRTKSGYMLFDSSMIDRVKEIRRLQNQRLTLLEIKKELGLL